MSPSPVAEVAGPDVMVRRRVGRNVKSFMTARGLTPDDGATALSISRSSWFNKVKGQTDFTATELLILQFVLRLSSVQNIYDGPVGLEPDPVESSLQYAPLAQLAEQLTLNQRVRGSSP
jgi:hypothetical protein